jgi:hypothetical protein
MDGDAMNCIHKWVLEPMAVSNVYGSCVRCGMDKVFAGGRAHDAMAFRSMVTRAMHEGRAKKQNRVGIHLPGSPEVKEGEVEW